MKLLISDYPHPRQDYNPGKHIVRLQTLMSPKEKKAASTFHDVDSDYVVIRQNPLISLALHRLDREYYWLSKEDAMAWMQCVNDAIPILQEKLDKRIAELYPEEPEPEQEPEPEATVPEIEERHWYAHALLLAQTQRGKTNVICWRLATLLPQIARGRASVVLMEPKGVLTDELLHLAEVWTMRERLVIIDPQDTSVSVNIFDKGDGSNFATQQALERVQRVLNTVTTTLTSFQTDALNFALRAMFAMPGRGSLRTVVNILRRGVGDIPNLPVSVRDFFEHDFEPGKSQAAQIIARLNSLLANPTFEALFAAERSTFDMHEQLQAGKLIVINASAGNETYARFWIEEVAACIAPRFKIPHEQRTPTTFIIDEAQTWIAEDLHFAAILDKAAEARIGMLIAAHHMGQIKDPQVRGSIYTNTTLKFTAETHEDINALSRSMGNCKTDFLSKIPLYQFAYYGPNMPEAIKVEFPLVAFKTWQKMSREEYAMIRDDNRRAYAYDPAQPEPTSRTERLANTFDVHVYAFINNVPVRMVVDTGATSVVLSVADAKRVGVDITKVQFTGTSTTVGGTVRHADIVLPSMRVDSIELLAVHALVVDTNESLLGQTFLSRLESYHMQGDILTMVGPRPQSPRDPSKPSKEGW